MIGEATAGTMPPSEEEQIQELGRMLRLGPPTLVGPTNERVELPDSVYNILKDVVRHMAAGIAIAIQSGYGDGARRNPVAAVAAGVGGKEPL